MFLFQTRPKISTVIADLFSCPTEAAEAADADDDDDCDKSRSKILNPASDGDPVWLRIHEIETTPALGMTWTKAASQDRLMKLLKIDPRNIVRTFSESRLLNEA